MNFIRKGPGYLFLRTGKPSKLEEALKAKLEGTTTDYSHACEMAQEDNTIIFITPLTAQKTMVEDAIGIIYLSYNPQVTMAKIINKGITDMINKIDIGPGQLVMRIPKGNMKVVNKIQENYDAEKVNLLEGINRGEAEDTVLTFTDQPLRSQINSLKMIKENLHIPRSAGFVFRELRRNAVRYITHGLEDTKWHELKINIYDSDKKYEEQYDRLVTVLKDLEVGFILGESWTRDHAFVLLSVIAYQIKLFTILDPHKIKRILTALEYAENGSRIVDYDLYYNNKKIEWGEITEGKRKSRRSLGLKLREEIFTEISTETVNKVKNIEKELDLKQ